LYGVVVVPAHPRSDGTHAVHIPAVHSLLLPAVRVAVGHVVSFFMKYAVEVLPVHPVSNILILKSVVHSAGVNDGVVNDVLTVSLHVLHPLLEYCTFVLADGADVSVPLHVILTDDDVHVLFPNVVQLTVGGGGALVSTINVFTDNTLL